MTRKREDFFRNERLHERDVRLLREEIALKNEALWETVRRVVNHYLVTQLDGKRKTNGK
tara:strand:+ start:6033 stop:6209 length:177 start_codon:yes stop_codon:yes gene_type:complete